MQEVFAATAQETATMIVARAQGGNATAMRLCVERTPPDLELPTVRCANDAQKALDTVVEAFGRGAITARELPSMVAAVDRMARLVQRIEEMHAQEHERYKALRGPHGLHPDMLPKPTGEPDRVVEAMRAAGEEVPEYLATADAANRRVRAGLYSPVNSGDGPADGAPTETLAPSLPRERSEGGERSEPGGGTIFCSEPTSPPTPDPSPPRFARGEGNPAAAAVSDTAGAGGQYFPVNLENEAPAEPPHLTPG